MPKSLMLVLTNPASAEQRADFENWYDTKHLHDIAGLGGIVSATRYRIVSDVPVLSGLPGAQQASLAIYELEAETDEDLRAVTAAMQNALGRGAVDLSPTLDMATAAAFFAVPASRRITA